MRPDRHELYGRRRSRNIGVGLVLGAFVVLVFLVTLVKLREGEALGQRAPAEASQTLLPAGD